MRRPTRCGGGREVGLVADAAGRVEAHRRGGEEGPQVGARSRAVRSSPATTSAGRSGSESSSEASRNGRRAADTKARWGEAGGLAEGPDGSSWRRA